MNLSMEMSEHKVVIHNELIENIKLSGVIKSKSYIYNNLLGLSQESQIKCINEVNELLGYVYLTIYELKRHELLTNNSKIATKEVIVQQKNVTKVTNEFYQQQYRDLQKGYMQMLATSNV